MAEPKHLQGKSVKFGQGQDTTKGGRPKKIYTILKEMGYSKGDVKDCFGELIWYTHNSLKELLKDDTKPIITHITAKALLESKDSGDISKIKDILEQSIGKAIQHQIIEEKQIVTGITLKQAKSE